METSFRKGDSTTIFIKFHDINSNFAGNINNFLFFSNGEIFSLFYFI